MQAGLFLGERGGARLLHGDDGATDDGGAITARGETVPAGPGVGGEAIFTALILGTTSTALATLAVTPIVSGTSPDGTSFETELETQQIYLQSSPQRMSAQHKLGLTAPVTLAGVEVGRTAPRGTWFRARIVATIQDDGELILEGLGVEMEVVREAVPLATTPGAS